MLGPIFVFSLIAAITVLAIRKPAWGIIGFYGFYLLDAPWNWRWSLPEGLHYQQYLAAAVVLGFVLNGCRIAQQAKWSRRGIAAFISFFVVSILSTWNSIRPDVSYQFLEIFWKQAFIAILGILTIKTPKDVKSLLVVSVLSQGYNAYQINLDYFQTGISRYEHMSMWGSAGLDNNTYSLLTVPIIGICLSLALHEKKPWQRFLFFGISLLQIHQLMLMGSRGCMLGSLPMLAIILWYSPRTKQNIRDFVLAFAFAAVLAGPPVVKEFGTIFASEGERDSSAESRFYLWDAGLKITADYPVLGTGPNAARLLVPEYYEGGLKTKVKALHNLFLDVSTGTGIPGACLYFAFIAIPLIYLFRAGGDSKTVPLETRSAVIAGTVGYLGSSMFSSGILIESSYILIIAGYAILNLNELSVPNQTAS